jgi:hypothetical protein
MRIVVIGGGFVGQMVQLIAPKARVLDWRKSAPANHLDTRVGPQYLWEPIPGVESESFEVTTLVDGVMPTPERIVAYKKKIGKEQDGGDWGLQFQYKMTGWHSKLPVPRVEYARQVALVNAPERFLDLQSGGRIRYDLLINTIPLNAFLQLVRPTITLNTPFRHDPIYMSIGSCLNTEKGMVLNYISDPSTSCYRVTINGTQEFRESLVPDNGAKRLLPGKIHPHHRSADLLVELRQFSIYNFGRYATWRPDELAHETWKDIQQAGLWI